MGFYFIEKINDKKKDFCFRGFEFLSELKDFFFFIVGLVRPFFFCKFSLDKYIS